jgi:murein DD-endopeptidase MepM/ murein hydrolase activator NlpD
MAESHLILLPKVNYFKWVRAAQKYALTFGVNITPDPPKAGGSQTVTVAVPEDGYPDEGDITIWLKARYPNTTVDAIFVETPEELKQILDARAAANLRFGEEDITGTEAILPKYPLDRLYLFWPTDYATITQRFGANPEIYSKWGLHGHEGVDIRAPMKANVYACADGEVVVAENDPEAHVYGKHVRILHVNGYKTVYGHLAEVLVEVGQQVSAKELIGKADSTGNSTGSHLHLTLKQEGASERGETDFPGDIIDPTPFLVYPHQEAEVLEALELALPPFRQPTYPWAQPCLVGLNGRVDGSMQEVDFSIARTAKLEAIKLPANTPESTITKLWQMIPELFITARVTFPLEEETHSSADCLDEIKPEVTRLYELGVRFFEMHQSPNLQLYGLARAWRSGGEFAAWWLEVVAGLREDAPEARFGFPGLSPGGQVSGQRMDAKVFLDQADDALLEADWIGVNCFWSGERGMQAEDGGGFYRYYRSRFPEKLLFITEFGNVNQLTDAYVKGQEYVQYYESLREEPGIGAAFAQVISAASGYSSLAWRAEDGKVNKIPYLVGRRQF